MLTRYTMKCVAQKHRKTYDKYRIVGATALDPQNKIKRIYSFEYGCMGATTLPETDNFGSPAVWFYDQCLRTISRTEVEVYEADNTIDNVAFRREVDRRLQVKLRLAGPGYYNQICQSSFRYDWQDT